MRLAGHTTEIEQVIGKAAGPQTEDKITHAEIVERTLFYKVPLTAGSTPTLLTNKSDAAGIVKVAGGAVLTIDKETVYIYTSAGLTNEQLEAARDNATSKL